MHGQIGGGVLGDCFLPEERGQAVAIYSLAPLLGPVIGLSKFDLISLPIERCQLGPIAGAWIVEKVSWRWIFWSSSMACGVVQIFGLIFLQESR